MQHSAGTLIHIQLAGIQTCQAQPFRPVLWTWAVSATAWSMSDADPALLQPKRIPNGCAIFYWRVPKLPTKKPVHRPLQYTILHYLPLHFTTLHYTTLHYTTTTTTTTQLHSTTLHYTKLHYTTLHYTTLHYIPPHSTTPHYITLHYITLNDTAPQIDR